MKKGTIRVGLLAYGAIGHEHNLAVQNTNGLELFRATLVSTHLQTKGFSLTKKYCAMMGGARAKRLVENRAIGAPLRRQFGVFANAIFGYNHQ